MESMPVPTCGLPHLAHAMLVVGLAFLGLFAALGGLSLTQLAVPALRGARIFGGLAIVMGLLAIAYDAYESSLPGSVLTSTIAGMPIPFGGLVFLAVRKMAREQKLSQT